MPIGSVIRYQLDGETIYRFTSPRVPEVGEVVEFLSRPGTFVVKKLKKVGRRTDVEIEPCLRS